MTLLYDAKTQVFLESSRHSNVTFAVIGAMIGQTMFSNHFRQIYKKATDIKTN